MVPSLFNTGKKENKARFKPIPQYIKRGDLVLFTQGKNSIETKVLELSSSHILLDNIPQNIKTGKSAAIYNSGDGVPWKIQVPVIKRVKEGKDQYIRCEEPNKIELLNRRDSFRALIPPNKRYSIRFSLEERTVTARLIDISLTGAQIELSIQEGNALSVEQYIEEAQVQIEKIFTNPIGFTVKWKKASSNYSRLGILFDKIPEAEKSALSKLIFQFEREMAH